MIVSSTLKRRDPQSISEDNEMEQSLRAGKAAGQFLGVGRNSSEDAAPDPWWIADDSFVSSVEDHAGGKPVTVFSDERRGKPLLIPSWIASKSPGPGECRDHAILITPCTRRIMVRFLH